MKGDQLVNGMKPKELEKIVNFIVKNLKKKGLSTGDLILTISKILVVSTGELGLNIQNIEHIAAASLHILVDHMLEHTKTEHDLTKREVLEIISGNVSRKILTCWLSDR